MLFTSVRRCEYSFIQFILENEIISEKVYEIGRGPMISKMAAAVAKSKIAKCKAKAKAKSKGVKKTGTSAKPKAKGEMKRPAKK